MAQQSHFNQTTYLEISNKPYLKNQFLTILLQSHSYSLI